MARTKGTANLSGTIEPLAGGALDARSVVQAKADLTASGTFPYSYVGMETYVVAENKKYRLVGSDPTVLANWQEVGAGGGASSLEYLDDVEITDVSDGDVLKYDETEEKWVNGGVSGGSGHTIEDPEGTELTQRDTLQFGGDLEVSDDDENEKTVVAPHELTMAELAEIVTPLPSVPVNMPILFDETGTERVVGWYRLANGTKKPVYEKSLKSSWSGNIEKNQVYAVLDTFTNVLSDVDFICGGSVWGDTNSGTDLAIDLSVALLIRVTNNKQNVIIQQVFSAGSMNGVGNIHVNVRYTKTTDTPT